MSAERVNFAHRRGVLALGSRIAVLVGLMLTVGLGGGATAWAAGSGPLFASLPASGSTELQTARGEAVAASLPDGQVLIAGGFDGENLQSAELFNPSGDTFTALPASGATELQTARAGAVAASLPDGEVLIAGGANARSAELFDPSGDTFTALPASGATELQTARQYAVAASLPDGEVLIAGGTNSSSGTLRSAELFNPVSDSFTALPASGSTELQTPREAAVAASLPDGEVLIAGGFNGGDLQSAELFNPADDTFTALPASAGLPTARAEAVAASLPDGQVLIAGGEGGSFLRSADLFLTPPQAAVAGGDFGDQTVAEPSPVSVIVDTNIGAQALSISAASLGG